MCFWDDEVTEAELRRHLADADPEVRGYWTGKLLRQARPDDVPRFVAIETIRRDWSHLAAYLGNRREMWAWLLDSGWTGE